MREPMQIREKLLTGLPAGPFTVRVHTPTRDHPSRVQWVHFRRLDQAEAYVAFVRSLGLEAQRVSCDRVAA